MRTKANLLLVDAIDGVVWNQKNYGFDTTTIEQQQQQ